MSLLQLITPINLAVEEEKFFASSSYQPQFSYRWDRNEINAWLARSPRYSLLADAILNQDSAQITIQAQTVFTVPWSPDLLSLAHSHLTSTPPLQPANSPRNVQSLFTEAFKKFKLDYSAEIVTQRGFNIRPQPSKKRVVISESVNYAFFPIQGEIKHELLHIIRYENGLWNHIQRSENYLPTEEGLATYVHDYDNGRPTSALFQHAAEYAVTEVTKKGSLRDAVEFLISIGFPPSLAWQRAVRHKFGFIDTSVPGDIMKPAMYFAYSQLIKQLPESDRLRLFVGKIALSDLPNYSAYRGRWSKEELQKFFF